ncbi:DUF4403 family protein [Chryseobacterium carnipullorum]|uniref:DUF4403 family protein n=1 Tax=Chryseobacterium carnipullorum TaxID=1124835 RepID=UPI000E8E8076|nr:DUF4403 family protein [Chryseobacterium carnipullorum]MDN5395333.1 DUF4403 family protein [Chryseobacterium sp.]MDN5478794.1 DUF4403 family protein [Chryseobacterium sp.]HBV14215.1 hypothetical protein [Chryseobacterium carnipullorum]
MKSIKLLFLLSFAVVFGQTVADTPAYNFPKIRSSITMPVTIPLSEISNMINASVKDLVFQDDSYTDNNNDQFKVKVWKTRPIRLVGGTSQNILIEVPLKIWAEKGIGTLGVYSYQNTTFETVMSFNTTVSFNNNWTISTNTQPNGFRWVTKPVLDYGKIQIPITSLVEKSLKEQQGKFAKTIDQQMNTQLNFQQYAVMAWNVFSQPFNISEEYNTWLKISPVGVNITPLKFYGNEITTNIGMDIYSETFTGSKPAASATVKSAGNFNVIPVLADKFLLQTTANVPFSEATNIARNMFMNKEYDVRGSKVKIKDIRVYGSEGRVIVEAETEGYVNGKALISGIPVYDETKKKIVLSNTKFNLRTSNILQKTATLLFKGKIVKMIEDEYGIPTQDLELASKKSIEEAFNKEYYKGLKMNGRVYNLKPGSILLNDSGITAVIETSATLKLIINGI